MTELTNEEYAFEYDEDIIKRIADYMTGPYKREVNIICEGCGSVGTIIEEMPSGFMRLGNLHGLCADCLRIVRRSKDDSY